MPNTKTLAIPIKDWYKLHKGFTLELRPGFTALVGPNGAGKTTLLTQIKEFARHEKIRTWSYSNLINGGRNANDGYVAKRDMGSLATALMSSEGERIVLHFSNKIAELGRSVKDAAKTGEPLIVLLDAIDSGASIDRARELRRLFDTIYDTDIKNGAEVYLIMAVNHYELAKSPTDCVDARTGEHIRFDSYDGYADFICNYEKTHPRKT